jgi:hypothetical protein
MEMNTNNDKGMNAILKGVGLVIDEKTKASSFDKTLSGIVTKADYETNVYTVKINGYDYKNIPSTIKVNVNDSVMVMCPQNQLSQMFIYSKIDLTNYIDTIPRYAHSETIKITEDFKAILTKTATLTLKLESGCIYMLYGANYNIANAGTSLLYYSTHLITTSLLDEAVCTTPVKLNGSSTLPYTLATLADQTLTITNSSNNYESHLTLKKIF